MSDKILARGAEAVIIRKVDGQGNHRLPYLIKKRVKKSYRISEIDEKLRKLRTRAEGKILEKAGKIINCPKVIKIDEKDRKIKMEFIKGLRLVDNLDKFNLIKQKAICKEIGKEVAKLHKANIIHSDLTTSNMILKEIDGQGTLVPYLIDFGLSFYSLRDEDKAVDLHLFKQALESKHYKNWQELWKSFILGYKSYKEFGKVLKQFEKVEKRGRYKH